MGSNILWTRRRVSNRERGGEENRFFALSYSKVCLRRKKVRENVWRVRVNSKSRFWCAFGVFQRSLGVPTKVP